MPEDSNHQQMMQYALMLAQKAFEVGEIPVGAVLYTRGGEIIAEAFNQVETQKNPTAHAEMLVLQQACQKLQTTHLEDYILAVTLEPCAMCAQAMAHARLGELRFGAHDIKSGGTINGARVFSQKTCHHKPVVYDGIMTDECRGIMQAFFKQKRKK